MIAAIIDNIVSMVTQYDYHYLTQILIFTIWQAMLSTAFSVGGGLLLGRLLFSQQWLRAEKWLTLIMVMPTLSVAIGYMNILPTFTHNAISGLTKIVVCHCFFNVPLAALLIIKGYQQIPLKIWQLARSNRMTGLATFCKIEFPLLKIVIFNSSALIFAYCFSSFAIPLMMGSGPQTNTITVALYYNLIVQGHVKQAAWLLILKLCIGLLVLAGIKSNTARTATHQYMWDSQLLIALKFSPTMTVIIIMATVILLCPPLLVLSWYFVDDLYHTNWQTYYAAAIYNSLWLASVSSVITLSIGLAMLSLKLRWRQRLEQLSYIILMIPSFVLGYMLITLKIFYKIQQLDTSICLIIIYCTVSMPMTLKILSTAWNGIENQHKTMMEILRLPLLIRLRFVWLPLMTPALRLALVLTISYCLGDMGGTLLFDQQQLTTIPLVIYDACNQFDHQTARLLSGVIMIMTYIIFIIIHKEQPHYVTTR